MGRGFQDEGSVSLLEILLIDEVENGLLRRVDDRSADPFPEGVILGREGCARKVIGSVFDQG